MADATDVLRQIRPRGQAMETALRPASRHPDPPLHGDHQSTGRRKVALLQQQSPHGRQVIRQEVQHLRVQTQPGQAGK